MGLSSFFINLTVTATKRPDSSVLSRNHTGGTSPKQVKKEIGIAKKIMNNKKKLKK